METGTGLQRVQLSELTPDITNALIVGIIIAKQEPRELTDGRSSVWNFTLRDSPISYINVTCWGPIVVLLEFCTKFGVGDVVNVISPQVEIRKQHDNSEQYRPMVTSPYTLIFNDFDSTKIVKHEGNWQKYRELLNLTTKPIAGAITIADIHNFKKKLDGVDIFGVVRLIGKIRTVTTRIGMRQVRDVIILDQTNAVLKMNFWNPSIIARASTWKVLQTILFITDVRCEWSEFSSSMEASLTSRSIITQDPVAIESTNLKEYANKINPTSLTSLTIQDVSSIQNVMNIQQVHEKISNVNSSNNCSYEEKQFTAVLYAVITQLDLDGLSRITITKCSRCDTLIENNSTTCSNTECNNMELNVTTTFDIRVTLTDQTGSLVNCRLFGKNAEIALGCSVQQFLLMNIEEKCQLKWKFLMERCIIRIHISTLGFRGTTITILTCELASPLEVANRLPHF
ncbi:hypothetical protein FQA39_LY11188 [Lamprigera yunnana]|nr:hypothetical protein FQA39_LY11188 [Lamprigera yunnana]